jgi:protein-S-isoprenylcysteine O-methyltransferase Ste14
MNKQKLVTPMIMWLIVLAGILFSFRVFPEKYIFPRTFISWIFLFLAFAYWAYLSLNAFKVHRKAPRSVFEIDKLVKEGIYARVRHPMYSGDIVFACAIFLFFPSIRVLVSVVWLTLVLILWMRVEEKALTEKFGKEYANYKTNTPMIFPKTWKR